MIEGKLKLMKNFKAIILFISILLILSCSTSREGNVEIFGKSKLQKKLDQWIEHGGDLDEIIKDYKNSKIKKKNDAIAVSSALKKISFIQKKEESELKSSLFSLAVFFQSAASQDAFTVFKEKGLPELRRIFKEGITQPKNRESDLLFILKIFALYKQEQDIETIIEVAKSGFQADEYMWSVIFGAFDKDHPYWRKIADDLKDPLPPGFLAVAYLDFVNQHSIDGRLDLHPFNIDVGMERLEKFLLNRDEEKFSYALSAAVAIPFLNPKRREKLFMLARQHPDYHVRIESAWAAAKTGQNEGIQELKHWAIDVNFSSIACQYLTELGFKDEIPKEALDRNFKAKAEMANWLSHPMEFGRAPDKIEIFDSRELFWPPTNDNRKVWLFKYTYNDDGEGNPDIGVGMVGSVTFALFGENTAELSAEDIYGLHCLWELQKNDEAYSSEKLSAEKGKKILAKKNQGFD